MRVVADVVFWLAERLADAMGVPKAEVCVLCGGPRTREDWEECDACKFPEYQDT